MPKPKPAAAEALCLRYVEETQRYDLCKLRQQSQPLPRQSHLQANGLCFWEVDWIVNAPG